MLVILRVISPTLDTKDAPVQRSREATRPILDTEEQATATAGRTASSALAEMVTISMVAAEEEGISEVGEEPTVEAQVDQATATRSSVTLRTIPSHRNWATAPQSSPLKIHKRECGNKSAFLRAIRDYVICAPASEPEE